MLYYLAKVRRMGRNPGDSAYILHFLVSVKINSLASESFSYEGVIKLIESRLQITNGDTILSIELIENMNLLEYKKP